MNQINVRCEFYVKDVAIKDKDGNDTGQVGTEDWVKWWHPGQADRTVVCDAIRRVSRVTIPPDDASASMRAPYDLWQFLKPLYETWKRGEELPEGGTPLSAWSGCRREHVELFKRQGIRSVEDVANLTDVIISKLALPGVREMKIQAARFLAASDQNRMAAEMQAKDAKIAALSYSMDEMKEQVKMLMMNRPSESIQARVAENTPKHKPFQKRRTGWPKGKPRKKLPPPSTEAMPEIINPEELPTS